MKKVLIIYAGLGGERKLWKDVEVTAIEINQSVAAIYQEFYPNDKVIVGDAREYLRLNYFKYDFIWSGKPCTTHSRIRKMAVKKGDYEAVFPDFGLYEEIVFLKYHFTGKWVVENVDPYYEIPKNYKPTVKLDRHYIWCNFTLPKKKFIGFGRGRIKDGHYKELQKIKGINIDKYKIEGRRKNAILRSYLNPHIGKYVFDCAYRKTQLSLGEIV